MLERIQSQQRIKQERKAKGIGGRTPLKQKIITESDWKTYYGSSDEVRRLVESRGTESFNRKILRLCKTKGDMSYHEAKLQFDNDVLLREDYYNNFIGCKIHAKHLTG